MERECSYELTRAELRRGDVAVLYTDGITEAMNPDNEQFGEERLKQTIAAEAASGESSEAIMEAVFQEIERFAGEAAQHDDQTLVVMQRP
jgi:sigma-B regulation protein RsbU (phosphoserine phosphatase)